MNKVVAVDIGGTAIKFAIVDTEGEIRDKWQIKTDLSEKGGNIPYQIINSIREYYTTNGDFESVLGVGLGVPGPVVDNKILRAVNLGWDYLDLSEIIEKHINLPVRLINDANAAALGELWKGSATDTKNLIFVTLGTGVGGGIVINKQIITGNTGSGGEIGHIPVDSSSKRVCGCGNSNCLECYASATGLIITANELYKQNKINKQVKEAKDVFESLEDGDIVADQALKVTVDYLAKAVASLMNSIDPDEVVIGGGLSLANELLLNPLKQSLDEYLFPQIRDQYLLRISKLGNDAGALGSAYHLLQNIT